MTEEQLPSLIDVLPSHHPLQVHIPASEKTVLHSPEWEMVRKRREMAKLAYYEKTQNIKPPEMSDKDYQIIVWAVFVTEGYAAKKSGKNIHLVNKLLDNNRETVFALQMFRKQFISTIADSVTINLLLQAQEAVRTGKISITEKNALKKMKTLNLALQSARMASNISEGVTPPPPPPALPKWKDVTEDSTSHLIDLPLASERADVQDEPESKEPPGAV